MNKIFSAVALTTALMFSLSANAQFQAPAQAPITVEQAKNILQGQFGAPQQVQNTTSNDVVTAIMQPDKEEDIVIVDETTDLLSNNNDKLTELKSKTAELEAALKAQDKAYVAWMNDYSNSTKQQTYWDSVTYSGVITDKLLLLMNSIDSVLINDSVLDALNHLKQAVSVEDSTYVTWTSGGSWDNFATAMTTRYVNTQNFIQAVRHTHFADI